MIPRNLSYFYALMPAVVVIFGNWMGGAWAISNFIFTLFILAGFELIAPVNKSNKSNPTSMIPNSVLYSAVIFHTLSIISLLASVHLGKLHGIWILWGAISTGIASGQLGIIVAHEMIHRKQKQWQLLGKYILFTVINAYFYVDHLRVHHKYVGLKRDHATARLGENFYCFLARSIGGQFKEAISLAPQKVIGNTIGHVLILILLGVGFGFWVSFAFLIQGLFANLLLEYTNYIEHYGLSRKEGTRVSEVHSWQSDKITSRFFLFDLSRHADHHTKASKPYHTLESYPSSPVLPGGYACLFFVVLIPPVWFKLIEHKMSETTASQ